MAENDNPTWAGFAAAREHFSELNRHLSAAQGREEKLEEEADTMRLVIRSLSAQCERLTEARNVALEEQLSAIRDRDSAIMEQDAASRQVGALGREIVHLKRQVAHVTSSLEEERARVKDRDKRIAQLVYHAKAAADCRGRRDPEVAELQAALRAAQNEIVALKAELYDRISAENDYAAESMKRAEEYADQIAEERRLAEQERPEFPVYYDSQGREHAEF